jgi:hypothetical protein
MWGSDCRPNKIIDNLYLGSMFESKFKEDLLELGIKHILVAGSMLTQHYPDDFTYKQFFINDDPYEAIDKHFEEGLSFIEEGISKGGCFVHW